MIRVKWDRTGAYGSSQHEVEDDGDFLRQRPQVPTKMPPAPHHHNHHLGSSGHRLGNSGHRLGNSGHRIGNGGGVGVGVGVGVPTTNPRRRPPPPPPVHHLNHHLPSPVLLYGSNGAIPEMDTICEVAAPPVFAADWNHEVFRLNSKGVVCRRETNSKITKDEMRTFGEELLRGLIEHVHNKMLREFQFVEQAIPALDGNYDGSSTVSMGSSYASSGHGTGSSVRSSSSSICSTADGFRTMVDSDVPRCIFHTSENYRIAEKLLVFVCSSRGLSCGIWSRSLLLQEGVQVGSMVPYFRKAREAGYGILVMNPNMNTQTMIGADGVERKLPIDGSSTQEEHCDHVWQHYIFPSAAHKIHFIAYGYGGLLVTNLIEKYRYELKNRLGNVAFVESSHKVEPSWSDGFKRFFSQHSVCWKRSVEPLNVEIGSGATSDGAKVDSPRLVATDDDSNSSSPQGSGRGFPVPVGIDTSVFGCMCLSAGPDTSVSDSPAYTTKDTLETVFKFLATPSAYEFQRLISREVRMNALREAEGDDQLAANMNGLGVGSGHVYGRSSSRRRAGSRAAPVVKEKEVVTVDDFQLLRVVGRGAFGKVMLVRKKKSSKRVELANYPGSSGGSSSPHGTRIYAMKVIKKAAVFAKNQVEHTKTERRVLEGVDHPFAVKLRYAFQTESKLFFVMDYYNGGTLHFHLKQARRFDEERSRFYAAQVVLALSHLHTYNVVYRDLKPENILMDDEGFIAITDFGLSSDHFDAKGEGLKTFCGTPEYIAPELIRRQPYGKSVDYWSLGVMLFEMIAGHTPFFNTNRKRNFENIVRMPLRFPTETFSDDAKSLLRGLMTKDPAKRLGSGLTGANEIMDHPFFSSVDWERLYKRDVPVPFKPTVKKDGELTNIPEFFKRQDVVDSAPDMPAPIGHRNEFKGFTYVDPLPM